MQSRETMKLLKSLKSETLTMGTTKFRRIHILFLLINIWCAGTKLSEQFTAREDDTAERSHEESYEECH